VSSGGAGRRAVLPPNAGSFTGVPRATTGIRDDPSPVLSGKYAACGPARSLIVERVSARAS
jgi:hypothetical protein